MSAGPLRRVGHRLLCRRAHKWGPWMIWNKGEEHSSLHRRCQRCPAVEFAIAVLSDDGQKWVVPS